jgi:predicted lipid-binding transport protein (Tim44 family)
MSKCPYCNRRTNPLRWITVTNWTGYRCGFCGRRSRPPLWQSALAGGLGGAVGAGLGFYAIVNYGWIGFAALFVLVTTAVLFGMWSFCTLHPMEEKQAQQSAPPNGGPAMQSDNSRSREGPPSVS